MHTAPIEIWPFIKYTSTSNHYFSVCPRKSIWVIQSYLKWFIFILIYQQCALSVRKTKKSVRLYPAPLDNFKWHHGWTEENIKIQTTSLDTGVRTNLQYYTLAMTAYERHPVFGITSPGNSTKLSVNNGENAEDCLDQFRPAIVNISLIPLLRYLPKQISQLYREVYQFENQIKIL